MRRRFLYGILTASALGAIAVLVALLAQRPAWEARERAEALVAQAQELAARGEHQAAWAAVEQALVADPRSRRARRERAMQYVVQGKRKEAAKELVAVAQLSPGDPGAAWEAAFALSATGDTRRAVEWFRRVVALQPNNGIAHALIGQGLLQLGDAADAVKEAEEGARLSPRASMVYLTLGQAKMQLGDLPGAKAAFVELLTLRPSEVSVMLTLARLCVLMKQEGEASGYLAQALDLARTDPGARAAVERALGR
jgi:Flp pilus assembly protein TadD